MRGLPQVVQLEMQLALQLRQQARKGQMQPLTFGQVVRWLDDEHARSVLEHGEAWWVNSAKLRWPTRRLQANPLAWLRYVRQCAMALREEHSGEEVWRWDTWPTDRIDVDGRWAHQPARRIYFAEIDPMWLREMVKRWARWRITSATKSPASIAVSTSSIRRFCRWAETNNVTLGSPAMITRAVLERADVFLLAVSPNRKSGLLTDLKVFLDDVRLHEWADGLSANATYYRGEIPRARQSLPRFIDEYVMGQLETDESLDRLPDLTTRTAVVILIETGLRSIDCLRLRYDPITTPPMRRARRISCSSITSSRARRSSQSRNACRLRSAASSRISPSGSPSHRRSCCRGFGRTRTVRSRSAGARSAGDWSGGWPTARSAM